MSGAVVYDAILRSAAMLVAAGQRAEWLAEWRGELWHVRREGRGANVTAFCLGAFRDAFGIWRDGSCPDGDWLFVESPARCLGWLALLGALCVALALVLPGARTVLIGSLYPRDLVLVAPDGVRRGEMTNGFVVPYPSVSWERFESLKAYGDVEFSGLAFYVPTRFQVKGKRTLSVARTTADLLRVLNIPAGREAFAGVMADSRWNLPGVADGWLIEDEAAMADLPARTMGFVVGRLRQGSSKNGLFYFVRLADRSAELLVLVPVIFLFACVLFRTMTGGFGAGHLRSGPCRGLFLVAKAVLVLVIVEFGSLDLGSLGGAVTPVFLDIAFFGSLLGVRWMVADQRKRCPVCLRLLVNPVRIGETSRILLEWHGTELMCPRGHGMLYVPEWPALWSGRERWMGMGSSWSGLFL